MVIEVLFVLMSLHSVTLIIMNSDSQVPGPHVVHLVGLGQDPRLLDEGDQVVVAGLQVPAPLDVAEEESPGCLVYFSGLNILWIKLTFSSWIVFIFVTHVSISQLGLELHGDATLVGVKEEDLVHGDPDPGEVVVSGGGVVVPDGDYEALPDQVAVVDADKPEGVFPHGVERLVHGLGLHIVLLEPGLGMLLPVLLLVQEVDQGVGVLAPLAEDLVSRMDVHLKNSLDIANLKRNSQMLKKTLNSRLIIVTVRVSFPGDVLLNLSFPLIFPFSDR